MTWQATVTMQPAQKLGTKEECTEWAERMLGLTAWVMDPKTGLYVSVGVIKGARACLVS
jgi:hypothetical protein